MSRHSVLIAALIILAVGYLGWLGVIGLRAEEPRRALVSIEMMENGDMVLPNLLGWTYYNKPPLFNWIMILFFKIFGSTSEWIVRLPSLISLFLMAFFTWKWAKKYIHQEIAILSSLFLLTSADILYYGSVNTGEIDLFYAFITFLNILVIYTFLNRRKYLHLFFWSYLLAALGFLTKGLPAITFQGFTLIMALIYFRRIRLLFHWKHLAGILLFLVITGGYIYLLYLRDEHMGFLVRNFKEASQRTGLDSNIWNTLFGIVESPMIFLKILLPWSLAIPMVFIKSVRRRLLKDRYIVFVLLVLAVNFPIYWITGELRARYIYPLVPFACIVLAYLFYEGINSSQKISRISFWIIGFMIMALPGLQVAAFFVPLLKMNQTSILLVSALTAGSAIPIYFLYRNKNYRIYLLFLLFGIARISMNIIYIPLYDSASETTHLREQAEKILEITGDETFSITGTPHVYDSRVKFFGQTYLEYEVVVSPVISYQLPYYYYQKSGKVLNYTQNPTKGNYYLVVDHSVWKYPGEVLYTFRDRSIHHDWHLLRYTNQ